MKTRKFRFWILLIFAGTLAFNTFAQTEEVNEIEQVRKGAETFLQTIREEKWDELDNFVVIATEQTDKETGKRTKVFHFADNKETKEKIVSRFKQTYSVLKPGKIITVSINQKDKTIAGVSYKHGDKDGFRMVLVKGEWYYMVEYLI